MITKTVTVPNFELQLTLEQIIAAVRQLGPRERSQLAQVLVKSELDEDLHQLIEELYSSPPVMDISDEDIQAEVRAVRQQH